MDPVTAAIMGGSMLAAGGISTAGAIASNKAQRGFAREMFKKQVKLDNTAVQRRAQDLRDAGMNPLLAASGGVAAGTPSASTGRFENEGKSFADQINPMAILDIQTARANIGKTKAETLVSKETAKNLEETNKNIQADTLVKQWNAAKIEAELSGTTVNEAGFKLFGVEWKWSSKTYNQTPAATATSGLPSNVSVKPGTVRGEFIDSYLNRGIHVRK